MLWKNIHVQWTPWLHITHVTKPGYPDICHCDLVLRFSGSKFFFQLKQMVRTDKNKWISILGRCFLFSLKISKESLWHCLFDVGIVFMMSHQFSICSNGKTKLTKCCVSKAPFAPWLTVWINSSTLSSSSTPLLPTLWMNRMYGPCCLKIQDTSYEIDF